MPDKTSSNSSYEELWDTVPKAMISTLMGLYLIWILVPLVGNTMLLFISLRVPDIRKDRTTLFLISTYIASLMVTLIATPAEMFLATGLGETFLPPSMATTLCKLCVYSFNIAAVANVWSQAVSVLDQWLSIVHGKPLSKNHTKIVISFIWISAAMYAVRNLITTGYYVIPGSTSIKGCTENANFLFLWKYLSISDIMMCYTVPMMIFVLSYTSIKRQLNLDCSCSYGKCTDCQERGQVARTIFVMGICFGILLFPKHLVSVFMAYESMGSTPFLMAIVIGQTLILITLSHDSVSIFVGLIMDKKLRHGSKQFFKGLWNKNTAVVEPLNDNEQTSDRTVEIL